jgi:excisionase family DNA binding protein
MSIASCGLGDDAGVLVVAPRRAARMLDIGITRLYELLAAGELDSFKDGKSRRITTASIRAYVERKLGEEAEAA